ncbi:MAG: hypothetical protein RL148_2061 [Planctomycetota bacterium]
MSRALPACSERGSALAPLLLVLGLVAAGLLAWVVWSGPVQQEADAPAPTAPGTQVGTGAPVVAEAAVPHVEPAKTAAAPAPQMQFPDGSVAPALNGVTESVKLVWNDRPYSPIRTKVVDRGWEWYVHEDGSHSTVKMVDLNGVPAPIGIVASPTESLPTSVEIEARVQEQLRAQQAGR